MLLIQTRSNSYYIKEFLHSGYSSESLGFLFKSKSNSNTRITFNSICKKIYATASTPVLYTNEPVSKVKIKYKPKWIYSMGYIPWTLHDPRGFLVNINNYTLGTILKNCTVIDGEIQEEILYHIPYKYTDLQVLVKKDDEWVDNLNRVWQ